MAHSARLDKRPGRRREELRAKVASRLNEGQSAQRPDQNFVADSPRPPHGEDVAELVNQQRHEENRAEEKAELRSRAAGNTIPRR